MKTIQKLSQIILFAVLLLILNRCEPTETIENDDSIDPPPKMGILTTNPESKFGELTIKLKIRHDDLSTEPAPWPTFVYLYKSFHNFEQDIYEFETYTYQSDSIYFGYLSPNYDYYIYAYLSTKYNEYTAIQSVSVYANTSTVKHLVLEKETTDSQ